MPNMVKQYGKTRAWVVIMFNMVKQYGTRGPEGPVALT